MTIKMPRPQHINRFRLRIHLPLLHKTPSPVPRLFGRLAWEPRILNRPREGIRQADALPPTRQHGLHHEREHDEHPVARGEGCVDPLPHMVQPQPVVHAALGQVALVLGELGRGFGQAAGGVRRGGEAVYDGAGGRVGVGCVEPAPVGRAVPWSEAGPEGAAGLEVGEGAGDFVGDAGVGGVDGVEGCVWEETGTALLRVEAAVDIFAGKEARGVEGGEAIASDLGAVKGLEEDRG
ncbi:hypothetical protein N657DRAFT_275458 [Parathielavia appendiculata]|uniref:Uncharacterized protein n=1 Tax=Parathielavia appendiculata TaxID=2587402 RepID=A0AAN6Z684_9PEZI|nr:hypothetical protein N657DRAFT_275458 [Parathielavia appendiculata]